MRREYWAGLGYGRVMKTARAKAKTVEEYIGWFEPKVQKILKQIRKTVRAAAPGAEEVISYGIPALKLHGMLVFYAAFQKHIGFYPPVRGDEKLMKAVSRYAGEKGNLQFPLDEPIPYALIERITKAKVKQNLAQKKVKSTKG